MKPEDIATHWMVLKLLSVWNSGITYRDVEGLQHRCKVQVLQVIADLPAKAQLLNHLQYNGHCGCSVSSIYMNSTKNQFQSDTDSASYYYK